MQLESVRALKAELAERVVTPFLTAAAGVRPRAVAARSLATVSRFSPGIALGVAAGRSENDFRIAVRVQRRAAVQGEALDALRERIAGAARNEVDLRVVGTIRKLARPWYQRRQRPLLAGCSVGHVNVTAGTLGCFVRLRASDRLAMLSNSHVLADEGRARIGDPILQPGTADRGALPADRVAKLAAHVPLSLSRANAVDAAAAELMRGVAADTATIRGLGAIAGVRADPVLPGMAAVKLGRTTGLTRGRVTAIELDDVVVDFEIGQLRFDGQSEIEGVDDEPFSAGGDSGSVILDEDDRAWGLLFAGTDAGGSNGLGLTYANDLALARRRLGATLVRDERP
ncbi:MAG: S1 family peptidase [Acetobacteraceae bacterium]|nr:S1 family peptidase [Acetobacteraceae bacterium]